MSDRETVEELVSRSDHSKIWLCPSVVSNRTYATSTLLQGIDCSKSTIPEELKGKEVNKHFIEDDQLCIIWENKEGDTK